MKRCYEIREVLVKISFIGATQLFATIGIALGRDDPPPSAVRPWAPPALPRYEGEFRQYQPTEVPRKLSKRRSQRSPGRAVRVNRQFRPRRAI